MAEEYVLTDPIVVPAISTSKYQVVHLVLEWENKLTPTSEPSFIIITLKDDAGVRSVHNYQGPQAKDFMKFMNTANFSTNSMQKRILQKLQNDGKIPPGNVTGTPDV